MSMSASAMGKLNQTLASMVIKSDNVVSLTTTICAEKARDFICISLEFVMM